MGETETIIGVVVFVIIFLTVSYIWVRTHKSCFNHIENGRQHALLNQEHMADAHEHKEQRNHERDIANKKRQWEREDHEHERSQRTSARTQPQNEHHDAVTHESVRQLIHEHQDKRDQEHHATPHREAPVFGGIHTSHTSAPNPSAFGSIYSAHRPITHPSVTHSGLVRVSEPRNHNLPLVHVPSGGPGSHSIW